MSLESDMALFGKLSSAVADVETAIESPEGEAIMADLKDAVAKLESYFASKAPAPVETPVEAS